MKCGIYARVSTEDQNLDHQVKELKSHAFKKNYRVYKVYQDTISGKTTSRTALNELLKDAHEHKFDVVLVWKLDRMGRSLQHLIKILDWFRKWNIHFDSMTENIDTNTPSGELHFNMIAIMAQYEHRLISDRTKLALKHNKRVGKRGKDQGPRKTDGYKRRYSKQNKDTPPFS